MECRKEAVQMMVRHGVVLMRGGGRKESGKRTEGGGELTAAKVQTGGIGNVDVRQID
jgi:hypothetical protein